MRIGIVGYGVIGMATASIFPDITIYDPTKGFSDRQELVGCDVVFVCLPTPTIQRRQDLSTLHQCLEELSPVLPEGQVVAIRSTVLPGTTGHLQRQYPHLVLAANPEFLRSHRAMDDARHPFRVVIGADDHRARHLLAEAYQHSLAEVHDRLVLTDTLTAELIKYAANCYLAMKISYFNEMYDICQALSADYETLRLALGLDPRIGPGEETMIDPYRRGYDDECLPKDMDAFISFVTELGFPATLFRGTAEVNSQVRTFRPLEEVEL